MASTEAEPAQDASSETDAQQSEPQQVAALAPQETQPDDTQTQAGSAAVTEEAEAADDRTQAEEEAATGESAETEGQGDLNASRGLDLSALNTDQSSTSETQTEAEPQAEVEPQPEPTGPNTDNATEPKFALSTPVIILPSINEDAAPALVQPTEDGLTLLQPGGGRVDGVVLDRITYGDLGQVQFSGRGTPGRFVRIYGNGQALQLVQVDADGTWSWSMPRPAAEQMKLFRFDQLDASGGVASRIETPFEYSSLSPQVLRERKVVIQKGDVLWRIAEQFYGEGIRYSMIYGANTQLIRDPDLIYPGQVFLIPELVDAN